MAKKTKTNKIDTDLDVDISGDFGDDLDFGDLESIDQDRNPSKIGVAKELATETGKGFLDGLVKQTAKKSLPDEYTNNFSELMDYADFAKSAFDENKSKINRSIYKLGKEVKKILPFQFKMLNSFLEKFESDFEQHKQESEEAIREGSIQSSLSGIFDKQLEVQKALEARRESRDEAESRERIVSNKLNIDRLTSIDSNISNQTAFTLQISKEYYRKNLELQYRTYFIQADMLKTMRDYYKGFSIQFESIVKNTGLPEFVKLNNSEFLKEELRRQAIQGTYNKIFTNNKYIESVKRKTSNLINEKVSSITDNIDNITGQLDMINSAREGGGGNIVGSILSSLLGSTLGEKLGDKISPKIKDKIKNNKQIITGANYLTMLSNSPSTLFSSLKDKADKIKDENSDEGSPSRFIKSKLFGGLSELLGVTSPEKMEYEIQNKKLLSHNKPAIFDNNVHRSITETIPMYLAKILKENTDLRSMYYNVNLGKLGKGSKYKDSDVLHYDFENRKLVTLDTLKNSIEKDVLSTDNIKGKVNRASTSLLESAKTNINKDSSGKSISDKLKISQNSKLLDDKKSKKLLDEYLSIASKDDSIDFSYNTLISNYEDIGKSNSKLASMIETNPKLKEVLEILKNSKQDTNSNIIDNLEEVKRTYPITSIKKLFLETSKLSGGKIYNNILDDQATIISKGFITLIAGKGEDLSIKNILNGRFMRFMDSKKFDKVKDSLTIFINDVKKIYNIDDMLTTSSLEVLLGAVNVQLRETPDLDVDALQVIHDKYPDIIGKGKVSIETLVERKIITEGTEDYVSVDNIRSVTRTSKLDIDDKRNKLVTSKLDTTFNSFSSKISSFYKDATNQYEEAGNNPFAKIRAIVNIGKQSISSISSKTKEMYNSLYNNLSKAGNELTLMIDNKLSDGVYMYQSKIKNYIANIDNLIKSENDDKENKLKLLEETKANILETVKDPSAIKDIDNEIKRLNFTHSVVIKGLESSKEVFNSQVNAIQRIINSSDTNNDEKKLSILKVIRDEINNTSIKLQKVLDEAQAAEKMNNI